MKNKSAAADIKEISNDLKRVVEGEVKFDSFSRYLYSTDASIYQILPIGVVLPKSKEDVIATIELANQYNVSILPRGGGTSLAGSTVGNSIVLDFSKYMRKVVNLNTENKSVRVQPGIIIDELNHYLSSHNLLFAPDPSSSNRGNIGGALGNNSCGAHSIRWGKTSDNVNQIESILSDGSIANLESIDLNVVKNSKTPSDPIALIASKLHQIGLNYSSEIDNRYPKIMRRVSGYNLDQLIGPNELNLAKFVVGSEGTLLTITEAELSLVDKPKHKGLAVIHFNSLIESMEATVSILELDPSAVEHVGEIILDEARRHNEYKKLMDFVDGRPNSLLLVEFTGETEGELQGHLDKIKAKMSSLKLGYHTAIIVNEREQAKVWAVRRAGLGLMMNVIGDAKPLPFVEDTAVEPHLLPKFVKRFDEILKEFGTEAGYYGHASVGCLHIRPLINLKTSVGIQQLQDIADEISSLVLEFGGSISGEHGDGLVRSPFLEKMFGIEIMNAFAEVKDIFDPQHIMNPGKITSPSPITHNLRKIPIEPTNIKETAISFKKEGGINTAIEMCNGQGACRKVTSGTMCPSFMATRDEEHSTRGRANALRTIITGNLPLTSITGDRIKEIMDLCLSCKACKAECPSNVDMAKLKYDFLSRYREVNGDSFRDLILGNLDKLGMIGTATYPISNWLMSSWPIKMLLDNIGIDSRRSLPKYSDRTFKSSIKSMKSNGSIKPSSEKVSVALFNDTFTNYHNPEIGQAAIKVLERLGYEVMVPDWSCCGRINLSVGDLESAKWKARKNIEVALSALKTADYIVGLEPSCLLSFKDEYLYLFPGDKDAISVANKTILIDELLMKNIESIKSLKLTKLPKTVLLQTHCHQKALLGKDSSLSILKNIPNCNVIELNSGCCGMAGSFGFEKEHYEISMNLGEMNLFDKINQYNQDVEIVSMGTSCRQQINDGTGRLPMHIIELLSKTL
ncbi:MAG: oxidoreductase [Dehalococcoidia bacterium]|nr:oxidoreductase [Dehalococcoidia bacterium]MQG16611.1 FAD-binding protein [SAR202 cluster bacterium]